MNPSVSHVSWEHFKMCAGVTPHFVIQVIVAFVQFLQSEIPLVFHMDFGIKLSCGGLRQLKHTNMSQICRRTLYIFAEIIRNMSPLTVCTNLFNPEVTHRFLTLDDPHSPGHIQRCLSILIGWNRSRSDISQTLFISLGGSFMFWGKLWCRTVLYIAANIK